MFVPAGVRARVGARGEAHVGAHGHAPIHGRRRARQRPSVRRLFVAGVLAMAAACASPAKSFDAAARAAIVDSVGTMLTQWRDALNAMDFDRAVTFYSADSAFRWYEDGKLTFTSAKVVHDSMLSMKPSLRAFEATFSDTRITPLAPGAAAVTSEFIEKLTDKSGNIVAYAGAISLAVTRGPSGWQVLVGHNSSLPPPVPKKK
jgi:ketosteroid isomerase-like protein